METIGHQKQREFLKKSIKGGFFAHAYLFSGQEKLGKKRIALETASLLLDTDCQSGHPDLMVVEPKDGEVKIGQIRDLISWLSLKPYSSRMKAAIIDSAHLMNQDAQTALLKTLEEPKGSTILILVGKNSEYLLPAILSRVQIIKFYPVKKEEIKGCLKSLKVPGERSEEIADISLGRPGLAVEYAIDQKKLEAYQEKTKEFVKLSKSDLSFRFQLAKELSENSQEISETLDLWTIYSRKVLMEKIFAETTDWPAVKKIKSTLNLMQSARLSIMTTNASPRLALENLMLEI